MGWINTSHRFDDRRAVFLLPRSQSVIGSIECGVLDVLAHYPENLHDTVLNRVLKYRPELAGCVVHWMDFRYDSQTWEFGVSHGSLPLVAVGDESPRIMLDKEREASRPQFAHGNRTLDNAKAAERVFQDSLPLSH